MALVISAAARLDQGNRSIVDDDLLPRPAFAPSRNRQAEANPVEFESQRFDMRTHAAIHPFTDGNGRTGRVLNLLYLVEQGLLDIPVLYLSRHILRNKADCYNGLQSITETGAWEPWLRYMLSGVTETARWTMNKIVAVRGLLEETTERMRRDASQIYSRELAELVFVRPYCRIAHVVEAGLAKRQTASIYLQALAKIGILREHKMGREKIFLNPAFIDLLKRD